MDDAQNLLQLDNNCTYNYKHTFCNAPPCFNLHLCSIKICSNVGCLLQWQKYNASVLIHIFKHTSSCKRQKSVAKFLSRPKYTSYMSHLCALTAFQQMRLNHSSLHGAYTTHYGSVYPNLAVFLEDVVGKKSVQRDIQRDLYV